MKRLKSILLIISLFFFALSNQSCEKDSLLSEQYFSVQINSVVGEYEPQSVVVKNGITVIGATTETKDRSESVIIIVNGDKPGEYEQVFDYKTGVSVKSSGLTYKIIAKHSESDEPNYYTSYEGKVIISEMDKNKQLISGNYHFYTRSMLSDAIIHEIKGEFLNLPYD